MINNPAIIQILNPLWKLVSACEKAQVRFAMHKYAIAEAKQQIGLTGSDTKVDHREFCVVDDPQLERNLDISNEFYLKELICQTRETLQGAGEAGLSIQLDAFVPPAYEMDADSQVPVAPLFRWLQSLIEGPHPTGQVESLNPAAVIDDGEAFLGARNLAEKFAVPQNALEQRLKRWRSKNKGDGWIENPDRKPREPQYIYSVNAVMPIIESMKAKATVETTGERPTKKN